MSYRLQAVISHVPPPSMASGLTHEPLTAMGRSTRPKRSEHVSAESVLTTGKISSDRLGELSK